MVTTQLQQPVKERHVVSIECDVSTPQPDHDVVFHEKFRDTRRIICNKLQRLGITLAQLTEQSGELSLALIRFTFQIVE